MTANGFGPTLRSKATPWLFLLQKSSTPRSPATRGNRIQSLRFSTTQACPRFRSEPMTGRLARRRTSSPSPDALPARTFRRAEVTRFHTAIIHDDLLQYHGGINHPYFERV